MQDVHGRMVTSIPKGLRLPQSATAELEIYGQTRVNDDSEPFRTRPVPQCTTLAFLPPTSATIGREQRFATRDRRTDTRADLAGITVHRPFSFLPEPTSISPPTLVAEP